MATIAENLAEVKRRMAEAAEAAGRDPEAVALVAVSKVQPPEAVEAALAAGQRVFGENRVQEAKAKFPALRARFPDLRLHLIGPLQTNKVKEALALFDVIETLDRPKLAQALAREAGKTGQRPACFVQVNTGEEPQKAGIMPRDADAFVAESRALGLEIRGLMCIPPVDEEAALHFAFLREIARRNSLPDAPLALSMGMSGDYETAIRFGADLVRVGTGVFGPRPVKPAAV
ncbi:YggS family pyridoxal phosphate-dependent enzyme [Pelagibius litoralis]|uniref:Pyridoxal phosphate homeostasis protein n=1 Tax=Pelagibius litoralis TaxID=374515 RepID=A0A967KAK3_9PROT|nr:YggS family pyridoxal phosphate-dependent enzyme [Pelagibius litoralis]NIA71683.1 YggS family pyridoxal phosphate-dependent enzyme [Pelagibius litoralis]